MESLKRSVSGLVAATRWSASEKSWSRSPPVPTALLPRPDGSVEWLDRPRPQVTTAGVRSIDRSTQSSGAGRRATWRSTFKRKAYPGRPFDAGVKNYVCTRRQPQWAAPAGVEFVNEPIKAFTTRLREKKAKDIGMTGGAGIIASFLDEGEVDEFMIHVIPKFIGEGIPVIAPGRRTVPLKLILLHEVPRWRGPAALYRQ